MILPLIPSLKVRVVRDQSKESRHIEGIRSNSDSEHARRGQLSSTTD